MMGMQKGKVDDAASILRLIRTVKGLSSKELKTKIELSPELVNYHLNMLVSKKLAELIDAKDRREDHQVIRITDRGTKFLELYEAIKIKYLTSTSKE
jgi:predicted transcriptional regulator